MVLWISPRAALIVAAIVARRAEKSRGLSYILPNTVALFALLMDNRDYPSIRRSASTAHHRSAGRADNRQLRQAEYRILSNAVWRSTIRNTLIVNAVHLPVSLSRSTLFDTLDFVGIGDADSSDESAYGRQVVER
jgi:hypothetical protein